MVIAMLKIKSYLKSSYHFFISMLLIILTLAYSYTEDQKVLEQNLLSFALIEAKHHYVDDLIYKTWASLEGGIYVPIKGNTKSNPKSDVLKRNIVTKDGLKLTLVNPAHLAKMIHESNEDESNIKARILSLTTLNPKNQPDDWEKIALTEFAKGLKEKHNIVEIGGKKVLRYIAPFIVKKECIKCHAQDGYKEGEIRGGISINVLVDKYKTQILSNSNNQLKMYIIIISFLLFYFIYGSVIYFRQKETIKNEFEYQKNLIKELNESEKLFRLIFEHSPLPMAVSQTIDGKIININKKWEQLFGYSAEEAIGKSSMELNLWKSVEDRNHVVQTLKEKEILENLYIVFKDKNGNPVHTISDGILINNKKYIFTIIQDVGEKIKYERALNKEKELFKYINEMHSVIDKINDEDFYNLAIEYAVKLTGSKNGFFHRISEDQKEIILTTWNKQTKENCSAVYNTHYPIEKAGNWIDCLKTKSAVIYNDYKNSPNQKGFPLGHIEVKRIILIATYINNNPFLIFGAGNKENDYDEIDAHNFELFANELSKLIEKKNYIKKIKENERFLSNLIDNLPGFIYRCANDKDWTMYYISENLNFITGYNTNEFINNNQLRFNDIILPEFRDYVWNEIQEAIKNKSHYEIEYKIKKKSQEEIWVSEKGQPVFNNNGDLMYLEGFIQDITAQKVLNDQLYQISEKYKNLIEKMEQGLAVHQAIYDENGNMISYKFLDMNKSFEKMLGIKKEDFIGKTIFEVLPNTEKYWIEIFADVVKTGNPIDYENYSIEFDKYFHVVAYRNEIDQFAVIVSDITLNKKLEENLRNSESKYRRLTENAQDLIYRYEFYPNRGFTFVSNSATEIIGYTPEEFYQDPDLAIKLILDEDKKILEDILNGDADEIRKPIILRWKKKSGEVIFIEQRNVPIYDNNGNLIAIEGIARDITKLIVYENELMKFKDAVEQSTISIVITDINGNIEYVNKYFEKITGYTFNEVINQNPKILNSGYHSKEFYQDLWNTIKNGNTWQGILRNKKKNGEYYFEENIINPIKDKNGNIINFLGIKSDITKRLKMEEELNEYREKLEELVKTRTLELETINEELVRKYQTEKELEQKLQESLAKEKELNEMKNKFVASVSHEFRTPLSAILSSVQIIKKYGDKLDEEKLENHYSKIEFATNHIVNLLDDILLISRADREILKNNPQRFILSEIIDLTIQLQKSNLKRGQVINLKLNYPQNEIFIDNKLLQHIIGNLLSNALKYSDENSIIDLDIEEKNENLSITVKDKGIGIAEEDLPYIFEPFYRTENSKNIKGTGLGLNIVKRCVELMNGTIKVESKINEGTIFNVIIPLIKYEKENTTN